MLGKEAEVKQWQKNEGKVFLKEELWNAVSEVPLLPGDRVVIQNVDGLTVSVILFKKKESKIQSL